MKRRMLMKGIRLFFEQKSFVAEAIHGVFEKVDDRLFFHKVYFFRCSCVFC